MAPIPDRPTQRPDVAPAMLGLVTDIEQLVATACDVRQQLHSDPGKQQSIRALGEMIAVLDEVKLRLRVDASGYHRT